MGLFDRFLSRDKKQSRKARLAREREEEGDLGGAVTLYEAAELPDEVARVLLLRADAEPSAEQRIAFASRAAETAVEPELKRKALGRKARVAFDVLAARGGAMLKSEVLAIAKDLEDAGENERAADAFAMAGDHDAEVRTLTKAGAIERLEERLRVSESEDRDARELELGLRKIDDLSRTAERRAALELARSMLARRDDERLVEVVRGIRARLARGPILDLEIEGTTSRFALGRDVSIGRGDATIPIQSRAASRRHVRVFRGEAGPMVEDLGTRNGTTLAGARISGPLPVGVGVELKLGGEVPCVITPHERGVSVEVGGARFVAPLGPLVIGDWTIDRDATPDDAFVVLTTASGSRPFLGEYQLAPRIELAVGDELSQTRGGAVSLRVASGAARESGRGDG